MVKAVQRYSERTRKLVSHTYRFTGRWLSVILAPALCNVPALRAQSPLSTVQDVVFSGDGGRFNGNASIELRSVGVPNVMVAASSTLTIRIVDGNLRIQLAPTTLVSPGAYYLVRYSSGGLFLLQENWVVPQSSRILSLQDVRKGSVQLSGPSPPRATGGPVVGLMRSPGNMAIFTDAETPAGVVDGSNTTFTLGDPPSPPAGLVLLRNGLTQKVGLDYTLTGAIVTFTPAAIPQTGDVLLAWYRTAGPANRCLVSNGSDAIWNTCLYTGMAPGSVAFVDSAGSLTENSSSFFWDNTNARLGIGTNQPSTTVYVHDARASVGITGLTVRAGPGQSTTPLQRWLDGSGAELAQVDSDGAMIVKSLRTTTTAARAGLRDGGNPVDPSGRSNGDFWMNTSQQARKSMEAGQVHPLTQVLCSSTGGSTSSTTLTRLGSCFAPGFFFDAGDRIDIRFDYSHEGTSSGFTYQVKFGSSATLVTRTAPASETVVTGKTDGALHATGIAWGIQSWGSALSFLASTGSASVLPTSAFTVEFLGAMTGATTDTVTLRSFTVIRYPAQSNP